MAKKIFWISFFVLLLFAGFFVMTQETDDIKPDQKTEVFENDEISEEEPVEGEYGEETPDAQIAREIPEWVKPARWFRSNAGGMAIEEIPSRFAALRGRYALVIDFVESDELPEYLLDHYDDSFFIEIRTLYENGKESRRQWIFRDPNGQTRLVAVFIEPEAAEETENVEIEETEADIVKSENVNDESFINENFLDENILIGESFINEKFINKNEEHIAEQTDDEADIIAEGDGDFIDGVAVEDGDLGEDEVLTVEKKKTDNKKESRSGFIEIIDENNLLTSEYKYYDDGTKNKTEYYYKGGFAVRAVSFSWEEDEEGEYRETHTDYYYYNRSSFLRAVERVFIKEQEISDLKEPLRISFPGNILNAARNDSFLSQKLNSYPEFFGDIFVKDDSRIIYTTDERGRILTQTLYENSGEENKADSVIWVIKNTWSRDNIVSVSKKEGDVELMAEYEYDSSGNVILERNLRNGILERVVRTEGKKDIEELYFNSILVMQAVWEDGRKISETRVKNN